MEKLQKLLVHAAKHGPLELGGWKIHAQLLCPLSFWYFLSQNNFNLLG